MCSGKFSWINFSIYRKAGLSESIEHYSTYVLGELSHKDLSAASVLTLTVEN